ANSAILRLFADGQLATAVAVTVNSSGLFDLNNKNTTVASLSMTGGTVTTGTGTLALMGDVSGVSYSSTATSSGNLALGTGTFALASGAMMTVSALLTGNTGLTKNGPGSLRLTANNTYTGMTTVNGGSLVVGGTGASNTYGVNTGGTLIMNSTQSGNNFTANNSGTLVVNGSQPGGTVTVNNGGILRGTGSVGNVAVASGGTVNAGSPPASTGILTGTGNVTLNGTFVAQLNGTTAGATYNQLVITSET